MQSGARTCTNISSTLHLPLLQYVRHLLIFRLFASLHVPFGHKKYHLEPSGETFIIFCETEKFRYYLISGPSQTLTCSWMWTELSFHSASKSESRARAVLRIPRIASRHDQICRNISFHPLSISPSHSHIPLPFL